MKGRQGNRAAEHHRPRPRAASVDVMAMRNTDSSPQYQHEDNQNQPPHQQQSSLTSYQAQLARYLWYFMRCPTKGRSKDCVHPCPRYVHSGPCEPCSEFVELECYCEATGIVKPCSEWCAMNDEQKELVKCCRVRCAKGLQCGHQCTRICHSGPCADPRECVESVVRHCACERIERVFPCRGCKAQDQEVPCDDICEQLLRQYKQAIAETKSNPVRLKNADEAQHGNVDSATNQLECHIGNEPGICAAQNHTESPSVGMTPKIGVVDDEEKLAVTEEKLRSLEQGDHPVEHGKQHSHESEAESGFNEDNSKTDFEECYEGHVDVDLDEAAGSSHRCPSEDSDESAASSVNVASTGVKQKVSSNENISAAFNSLTISNSAANDKEDLRSVDSRNDGTPTHELGHGPLRRVSRSASRASNYDDEDVPKQLGCNEIVKIMRSSTRRKRLIKCDQANSMNNSSSP